MASMYTKHNTKLTIVLIIIRSHRINVLWYKYNVSKLNFELFVGGSCWIYILAIYYFVQKSNETMYLIIRLFRIIIIYMYIIYVIMDAKIGHLVYNTCNLSPLKGRYSTIQHRKLTKFGIQLEQKIFLNTVVFKYTCKCLTKLVFTK